MQPFYGDGVTSIPFCLRIAADTFNMGKNHICFDASVYLCNLREPKLPLNSEVLTSSGN